MVLVPHPVQRGDVAEPDQRLRVGLEGRDVDAVEQAGAAAPTSQGHDRPDVGVADRLVEIGEPVLVSSLEVAEPVVGMPTETRWPSLVNAILNALGFLRNASMSSFPLFSGESARTSAIIGSVMRYAIGVTSLCVSCVRPPIGLTSMGVDMMPMVWPSPVFCET